MEECFYSEGLKFSCMKCSRCCRHDPGFVFLSESDLARLLLATGLARGDFIDKYCKKVSVNGAVELSLIEKPNFDCIFWNDGGCSVYEHRPYQCRSFPFWSENVSSKVRWQALRSYCPGIDRGALHGKAEIDEWMSRKEPCIKLS